MTNISLETKNFKVTETGHDYDFARIVENKTDDALYFIFDEKKSDWQWSDDNPDELSYAHFVFKPVDVEDYLDADTEKFMIAAHDRIGLGNAHFIEA